MAFSPVVQIGVLLSLVLPFWSSCDHHDVAIRFHLAHGYRFTSDDRRVVDRIAREAVAATRQVLGQLPSQITVEVEAGVAVIPETGESGVARQPNIIWWDVDPHAPGGVIGVAERQLWGSVVHQLHHLARQRAQPERGFLDSIIGEGMASAFQRDMTGQTPPWAVYGGDIASVATEVLRLPDTAAWDEWLSHDAARRWTGQRVGTYLVDTACRRSNRTPVSLVELSTADVIDLAVH